jgi:hypothetical protein
MRFPRRRSSHGFLAQDWLPSNQDGARKLSRCLPEVCPDDVDDVLGPFDDVLVCELDDGPAFEPEPSRTLRVELALPSRAVGAVARKLDREPGVVPEQVDPSDAATCLASLDLDPGRRQPSTEDLSDRRLLKPAVAEWTTLGPVEEIFEGRNARPAAPAKRLAAPPEVRPPHQSTTFGIVEGSLQLAGAEAAGDVEQCARRGGAGNALAQLNVSRTEVKCSMDDARYGAGVTGAPDGDLDLRTRCRCDVEPPEHGRRHVGGDGALPRRKHRGQYPLIGGRGVGGVTHDAAANG